MTGLQEFHICPPWENKNHSHWFRSSGSLIWSFFGTKTAGTMTWRYLEDDRDKCLEKWFSKMDDKMVKNFTRLDFKYET
ncbi:hypothetical protein HZH66_006891 [Vespula vulgaris]|uniref:Uncharacterized protein n=1 Tax=Vespula vulgaris TaxID=7454 RepID=A0A834K253_VESVU|nr:hypothetical protein HZH66_006891 [Vespula vulgaris]